MKIDIGNDRPFFLIAGPCQIESQEHAYKMASAIKEITTKLNIQFIYKSSFDKANRTSLHGKRGAGLERGMEIFDYLKDKIKGLKIITDVHTEKQCSIVAPHVDALQIPAFLCRQTDLLIAAGETGKYINIKKGQFLAPWDMQHVADKVTSTGNKNIWLCDRGTSFGYNTLVSDMRGLHEMKKTGYPVVIDATHSCQQPGGQGTSSGGNREHIPVIASAAVAVGVAGVFIEVHDDPDNAASDGPNNLHLKDLESLLIKLKHFDTISKSV
jgi:2-dehydro-3-deoxyphosphooctonate aldolase (KDO 8-P synthase)|tara:strand:- start:3415 stop:4221 length:807 start_codon:yes stop_codon:yes gene_type:complete